MSKMNIAFLFRILFIVLIIERLAGCASVDRPEHIEATNPTCVAQEPPARAGEYVGDGGFQRVYPRGADMPPNFSGCQSVWYEKENGWMLAYRLLLQEGKVKKFITPSFQCAYEDGGVVSKDSARCQAKAPPLADSLPTGCLSDPTNVGKHPCLTTAKSWPPENHPPSPRAMLEACSINDVIVLATMPSFRGALMRCPGTSSYFPKVGDLVGSEKAKVTQITETSVTFTKPSGEERKVDASLPTRPK